MTKEVVRSEDAAALLIEELDTTKDKAGKDYDTWTWNMYYSKSIPRSSLCTEFLSLNFSPSISTRPDTCLSIG